LTLQDVPSEDRATALAAAAKHRSEMMPDHVSLLTQASGWARAAHPEQPLTAGLFFPDRELNAVLIGLSDVVSFHSYDDAEGTATLIAKLRRHGRPLLCTEYMARTRGCTFASHLPLFNRERVGCFNWGLVNGKTQTHIAWTGETEPWFHDIFRPDGTPYDATETELFREIVGVGGTPSL
jgi:hypothetical protein